MTTHHRQPTADAAPSPSVDRRRPRRAPVGVDVRPGDHAPGGRRLVRQARPAPDGPQPGDVRRRDRQRPHHVLFFRDLPSATAADSVFAGLVAVVAVVHRAVRQLRRGRGRRAGARRRPTRCARPGRRPSPTCAQRRRHASTRRPSTELQVGDLCVVAAGELIPGDGDIVEGIASVDESAITGESAPVIRESGGDRSAVTGGTRVLSDQIVVRITLEAGRDVPRPHDRARRRGRAGRRRRTRSPSTSCSPGSRSSSCWRS